MRFQVPQFIDVEDKIFGPFTAKQFLYLIGGAGADFVFYKLLPIYISIFPIIIITVLTLLLSFYRVSGRPFISILESAINYFSGSKLYIWKRRMVKKDTKKELEESENKDRFMYSNSAKLTGSKLRDLAWSLDVLDLKKDN